MKRTLPPLLALLLVLAMLAACAAPTATPFPTQSATSTPAPTSSGTPTTAPTADPSAAPTSDATPSSNPDMTPTGDISPSPTGQEVSGTPAPTATPGPTQPPVTAAPTKPPPTPIPYDITTAEMPTRTLANKTFSYYSWVPLKDIYGDTQKSIPALFQKEFGITTVKGVFGTHETYWDNLATLKASGTAPDTILVPSWNYYPIAITEELVQSLDSYIDFSKPLWNDVRFDNDMLKWKGQHYFAIQGKYLNVLFFFNKKMFRDNGIAKTPRDLYNEGNWTWDAMRTLADQFVVKAPDGTITQTGVGFQQNNLIATTGIELVQPDPTTNYKFNLRDPKIARMMNMFYEMGDAGTGSLNHGNYVPDFREGRLAMLATHTWVITVDFNAMRLAGNLDWVPMPKYDKSSPHYNEFSLNPGFAICAGAKNPEAAALWIEYLKWFSLGSSPIPFVDGQKNAASIKYKLADAPVGDPDTTLTAEQKAWMAKMGGLPYTTTMWWSWLGTMVLPGYGYVLTGSKQWSVALEEVYPVFDGLLKSYFK